MTAAIFTSRLLATIVAGSAIFFTTPKDFLSAEAAVGTAQPASLSALPAEVPAGVPTTIDIAGSGFNPCVEPYSGDTSVRVLWDGVKLVDRVEPAGRGSFNTSATVPADAAVGDHTLSAECSGSGSASSRPLAETTVAVRPPPALRLSVAVAFPGDTVTVTGDGFANCDLPETSDTSVRLLWDDANLVDHVEPAGKGHFAVDIAVPVQAAPADHTVAAECYNPANEGGATSGVLARSTLRVAPVVVEGGSNPGGIPLPPPTSASRPPWVPPPTPPPAPLPPWVPSAGPAPPWPPATSAPPPTASPPTSQPSPPGPHSPLVSTRSWARPITLGTVVAALLAILVLGYLRGWGRRRRGVVWARQHVRAVGHPQSHPQSLTATVERRPGGHSISIGLRPHMAAAAPRSEE